MILAPLHNDSAARSGQPLFAIEERLIETEASGQQIWIG
jgi:hypothetical protein